MTRPTRHNHLKHAAVRLVAQDETISLFLSAGRNFETVWRAESSSDREWVVCAAAQSAFRSAFGPSLHNQEFASGLQRAAEGQRPTTRMSVSGLYADESVQGTHTGRCLLNIQIEGDQSCQCYFGCPLSSCRAGGPRLRSPLITGSTVNPLTCCRRRIP